MSTRSQIVFRRTHSYRGEEGEEKSSTHDIMVYKHHDGYPRGTVPLLRRFHDYAGARANDIEYYVSSFVYWYKRRQERRQRFRSSGNGEPLESRDADADVDDFEVPPVLTGMGICGNKELHGDIEYLWLVDMNDRVIERYHNVGFGTKDWDSYKEALEQEPVETYDLEAEPLEGFGE